jgi:MMP 1-O-methyltransferase
MFAPLIFFRHPIFKYMDLLITYIRKKLLLSRIKGYQSIQGWLSEGEATHLFHFANKVPMGGTILEIGCWKGKSTFCLAKGAPHAQVFSIDPFNAAGESDSLAEYAEKKGQSSLLEQYHANLERLGVAQNVKALVGYSSAFINEFEDESLDLLFIDGDHSREGAEFDFTHFGNKVKIGGHIIFHDYRPSKKDFGPTWVINNLVVPSARFQKVGKFDSLWVGKRCH